MQLGVIGLGRMGANIARRLMKEGHACVVWDRDDKAVTALAAEGAAGAKDVADLIGKLAGPRAVWVMLPAGDATEAMVVQLAAALERGDTIIDGGNTFYRDDIRRGKELATKGLTYVDVGTSGGVWGLERGYCMMIGGDKSVVERLDPIFRTLAPGAGDIPRTTRREGADPRAENGYIHAGPVGAGHFVKMVHNGIEYGLMQAYAEGWELMEATDLITDVPAVVASWQKGTVIRSWLLDLMVRALDVDPHLEQLCGYAEDSGEGRWTVQAAVDHAVPLPVITAALFARFASRQDDSPSMKVVAALRNQFGGHAVTSSAGSQEKGADSPGADAAAPPDTQHEAGQGRQRGQAGVAPEA